MLNSEHHSICLDYSTSSHSCVIPKSTTDSTTLRVLDNEDKHSATSDHQVFVGYKQNETHIADKGGSISQSSTGEGGSAHTKLHTHTHTHTHTLHVCTQHIYSLASLYFCFCHLVRITFDGTVIEFFGRLVIELVNLNLASSTSNLTSSTNGQDVYTYSKACNFQRNSFMVWVILYLIIYFYMI